MGTLVAMMQPLVVLLQLLGVAAAPPSPPVSGQGLPRASRQNAEGQEQDAYAPRLKSSPDSPLHQKLWLPRLQSQPIKPTQCLGGIHTYVHKQDEHLRVLLGSLVAEAWHYSRGLP